MSLATGRTVGSLDRGEYLPETQRFPFAFLALAGGEAYVHGTDWNVLDISDAATGHRLTARSFPPGDRDRPLDYFHGELAVSPDGRWIADDGWVWHPVGVPMVWSVAAWLANPYEPEDGPTLRQLADRPNWNEPIVWCGDRVVLRGLSTTNGRELSPGAMLCDPTGDAEPVVFTGPKGRLLSFDGRLFSSTVDGLTEWNPTTGEHVGHLPGFRPTTVHPATGELLTLDGAIATIGISV
jgi:hypothetical protein